MTRISRPYRSPQWQDDRPVHMYRAPSLDMLPKVGTGHLSSGKELRRQRSYARDIARDVKSFHSKQGQYEFYPKTAHDEAGRERNSSFRWL